MPKILVEVSEEDQVFIEETCLNQGYTFQTLFKQLLDGFRKFGVVSSDNSTINEKDSSEAKETSSTVKRRGRPPKTN